MKRDLSKAQYQAALDPLTLLNIASEIEGYPYGEMRAKSLRDLAERQRAALAKAKGE